MMRGVKRAIVLSDMQCPYEDKTTLRAVEQFMATQKWDWYINIGDLCDFNELSSFNDGKPGLIEECLDETYDHVNRVLDRHQKIVRKNNPKAKFALIEGNHDYRATAYKGKHPELGNLLSVPRNLRLRERKIRWVRFWSQDEILTIGNANFGHGRFTNKYHAAKHADIYGVCFYYGHTHDVQSHTVVRRGQNKTIEAASMGCLCEYNQKYMKGSPSKWQQAFAIFTFFPDGHFDAQFIRIFKHRFFVGGKVYDGTK